MIKPGVNINGIKPEILLAYVIAQSIYSKFGYDCVITSVTDSKHGKGSLHYVGLAIDLRIRNIGTQGEVLEIYNQIDLALGDQYDVLLRETHIHIEYQPK